MKRTPIVAILTLSFGMANLQAQTGTIWFSTPNDLSGKAIWYGGSPEKWVNKKPISAGDANFNADKTWENQSIPIGNGSVGANIIGSVKTERITLNEKTLWRGGPNTSSGPDYYWNVNKNSAHLLKDIREAFTKGDQQTVDRLTRQNFNSEASYESSGETPFRFGSFTTMGELYIETGIEPESVSSYKRALSVDSALASVSFVSNGTHYSRTSFVSYPDNVMAVRFTSNKKGMQNLQLSYGANPVATGKMEKDKTGNGIVYTARLDNNQMEFAVRITAEIKGGTLLNDGKTLSIKNADEVIFYLTADTDYKMNFTPDYTNPKTYVGIDPKATTLEWMNKAEKKGYKKLLAAHFRDYDALFSRVKLNLNPEAPISTQPTPERLAAYRKGKADFALEKLYFQYGRYLLIASSRPGNLPANLQGIWHNNVDGPWRVDYHNNINIQMNYWPSLSTNLEECAQPLTDFIRTLEKPGEKTAKAYFGARGWTASISANIFGFTAPLESQDMSWNFNPMAGPWLATHIWDYYDFTRDEDWLRRVGYPLIKQSAIFTKDYLWKKPDGTYTAAPSTSPEHGPIDEGTTFVHAVAREILIDAIEAAKVLGIDNDKQTEWKSVLDALAPYKIGRYGQLMEWSKDIDDPKDEHRHVNHLFGLHPGHTVSPITTPELAEASRVVLEHRGDGATGWSMGWKLNQWARLLDGNHAYKLFGNLLKNGTLDNLWDSHSPFQIDGNFGGTSGVTEMLLQSHAGFVHLLPALPDAWKNGSVSGLRARGNFGVDIKWKNGRLAEAVITSGSGSKLSLRYGESIYMMTTKKGRTYTFVIEGNEIKLKN